MMQRISEDKIDRLGQSLRAHRENADMSQAELALAVDMASTTISDYEQGHSCMSLHSLVRMAEALGVEASTLIHDAAL